jgi:hypothetical protein
MSDPVKMVNHGPVVARNPPTRRQSENAARIIELSNRGDWMLAVNERLCRRSAAQFPSSKCGLVGML